MKYVVTLSVSKESIELPLTFYACRQALDHPNLSPDVHNKCRGSLREMCAQYALFPSSLKIELCDNPTDVVLHHGEFGDVSKRNYQGREVAVKTLKTCTASDLQAIIHVRC